LSLRDYVEIVRRRKWAVLETFGIVLAVGALATAITTPIFRSEAKLLVRATAPYGYLNTVDSQNPLVDLLALTQPESVETQIELLQSGPFIDRVLRQAGVTPLTGNAPRIRARRVPDTNVISISAESSDAKLARRLADTITSEY